MTTKAAGPEGPRRKPTREEEKRLREKQASVGDWADADGYCLEWYWSDPEDSTLGDTTWVWLEAGQQWFEAGWYYYHRDGQLHWFDAGYYEYPGGYDHQTKYNQGYMDAQGAGPNDWVNVYAHERAHQAGWSHFEEPESENAAYWPEVTITGT